MIAKDDAHIAAVQALWTEYWTSLGLPPEFQGFAEQLKSLPGEFAHPPGLLLLATVDGAPAGTIALRKLRADACELKRLYVRPAFRGQRFGQQLLAEALARARQMDYRNVYADTLPSMTVALHFYEGYGFVRCEPYSGHPTPGAIYLWLAL